MDPAAVETAAAEAATDLAPLLEQLITVNEYLRTADFLLVVLCGALIGCAVILILAVMFR